MLIIPSTHIGVIKHSLDRRRLRREEQRLLDAVQRDAVARREAVDRQRRVVVVVAPPAPVPLLQGG